MRYRDTAPPIQQKKSAASTTSPLNIADRINYLGQSPIQSAFHAGLFLPNLVHESCVQIHLCMNSVLPLYNYI